MNINKYDVAVIDYNTGNIDSVIKAIKYFNKSVILTNKQKDIDNSKRIILPGQGSFQFGMQQLEKFSLLTVPKQNSFIVLIRSVATWTMSTILLPF